MKSEEPPESNDAPVKIAVASTHEEIIGDVSKDVLVLYYAPWCGHCQSLAPVWEELGESLVDSHVTIAKMDATANQVPGLSITSYPTLMWYPMGYKKGIPCNGGR